jgi:hypothetical protein
VKRYALQLPRLIWCVVAACVLVLGAGFARGVAAADPPPIDPSEHAKLTEQIVDGSESERKFILKKILAQARSSHPSHYGRILGPIFGDPALTEDLSEEARRQLFAQLIAHLAQDQPEDTVDAPVLLVSRFVHLLAADEELLAELSTGRWLDQNIETGRRKGYDRLMRTVLRDLVRPDAADRAPCIRLAARSVAGPADRAGMPRVAAALYGMIRSATSLGAGEREALLDTFKVLVHYRFPDVAALQAFLEPFAERLGKVDKAGRAELDALRADLVDAVGFLGQADAASGRGRHQAQAIEFGLALIAKAAGPEDLIVFFGPGREEYLELQMAAVRRAAELKPTASKAWAALIERALDHSNDPGVLDSLVGMLGETFRDRSEDSGAVAVAAAVARRLRRGAETDTVRQRVTLAKNLSVIGTLRWVLEALPEDLANGNGTQQPVYAELIHALGRVADARVDPLRKRLLNAGEPAPDWQRQAVANALGFDGIRTGRIEGPRAALLLKHLLTGQKVTLPAASDPNATPETLPATDPERAAAVRIAAVGSLEHYPGPDTAAALKDSAEEASEEGEIARKALARQFKRKSVDAALKLAELIGETRQEARLLDLLRVVGKDAPEDLDGVAQNALAERVREVFQLPDADVTAPLRREAANVLVRLADVEAVPFLFRRWKPGADHPAVVEEWKKPLESLVVAVARAPKPTPERDKRLADALQDTFMQEGLHAEGLALYTAMGPEANGRLHLKRGRADFHYGQATAPGRNLAARRADLDLARQLFEELVNGEAPPELARLLQADLFRVLQDRAASEMLDASKNEKPEPYLLLALQAAVRSGSKDTATRALPIVTTLEAATLSTEQKQRLQSLKAQIQQIIGA